MHDEVRATIRAQHTAGSLRTAAEQCAAAEALVGSDDRADVELAHALALAAMRGDTNARPLAAAAYDRLRLLAGAPQKFGTQSVERGGRRELWPVDPATTDSERAKWGLPPLSELRKRIEQPHDG